jgi:hypothetical protein
VVRGLVLRCVDVRLVIYDLMLGCLGFGCLVFRDLVKVLFNYGSASFAWPHAEL